MLDTKRPVPGLIAHYGRMTSGTLRVGEEVRTEVNAARRQEIMRNHSATHLLHRALKDVLGDQVHQQGSLVAPDRLRFDFNLPRPMTAEELREVDRRVNDWILEDHTVSTQIMPYREALATGAMALFSEKYGDQVRVVTMGTSKELCGGTHVAATGQIGVYLTSQEASIGTSVRRIEALTGTGAEQFLRSRSHQVSEVAERLQTTPEQIVDRVQQLQEELSSLRRQLRKAESESGREEASRLAASPRSVRGVPLVAAVVTVPDERALREMGDSIRRQLGSGVILLGAELNAQARFIVMVDAELTARGLNAGTIARQVGEQMGGKGGGRPDSAQGGSKETNLLQVTIASIPDLLAALLG